MAWTVTVTKFLYNDSKICRLTFSDGTRTIIRQFDIQSGMTQAGVAARALGFLDWLNAQDASDQLITEGVLDPAFIEAQRPPAPPDPPAPDPDRDAWLNDWQHLLAFQRLIAAGVILSTNATYTALLTRVKNNFTAAYLNLV